MAWLQYKLQTMCSPKYYKDGIIFMVDRQYDQVDLEAYVDSCL